MIIIAIMTGALDFRGKFTSVVSRLICEQFGTVEYPGEEIVALLYGQGVYLSGKGGIWRYHDRKIDRFIMDCKHNTTDNRLVCIGKSYGCRDLVDILDKRMPELVYEKKYLCTIDPHWLGRRSADRLDIPMGIDKVENVYQDNGIMKGAHLGWVNCDVRDNCLLDTPAINHFNIIHTNECHEAIRSVLTSAIED